MKNSILLLFVFSMLTINAQNVEGKLSLNGKSKTELKLETNSVVQLFKEFKTGKYQIKFNYKASKVPQNIYKETIVFFNFITTIKKDGEVVKNVSRKQPIPFFPGDMNIPAEAFDFIGELANSLEDEEPADQMIKKGFQGTMPEGSYTVQLMVKPVGFKGGIAPLEFSFILRKRPGRTKY